MKTSAGLRWFKKLILGVVMLPVLLAALLALIFWLDSDLKHSRQQIEASFKQFTGHNLNLNGALSLELWPVTRFISRNVEVTNDQGKQLFTAEKLAAEVAPLSIIKGELRADSLILEKAQINLSAAASSSDVELHSNNTTPEADEVQSNLPAIPFKSIQVLDSAIRFDDPVSDKHYALHNLQIAMDVTAKNELMLDASLDFIIDKSFTGSFAAASKLILGEQLNFEQAAARLDMMVHDKPLQLKATGTFSLTSSGQLIQVSDAILKSEDIGLHASLNARDTYDSLKLEAVVSHVNPSSALMVFPELRQVLDQANVLRSFSMQINIDKNDAETRIDIPAMQLDDSLLQGSMRLSDKSQHFQLKVDELEIDPYLQLVGVFSTRPETENNSRVKARSLAVQVNRLVSSHGSIEGISTKMQFSDTGLVAVEGTLNADKLNLNTFLRANQSLLPETPLMQKLSVEDEFSLIDGRLKLMFDNKLLALSDIDLKVDDTFIRGELKYSVNQPMLNTELQIGTLDLDRYHYLFPSEEDPGESTMIDSLKSLKGSGSIRIESLRYLQTDYQQIDISFNDA